MPEREHLQRRHLAAGWWFLLIYAGLGLFLETLHGFKVQWYLSLAYETRRFLFTLGHAHGVLLSILNIVYALALPMLAESARRASIWLLLALLLLPVGFFLGGIVTYGGDPGVAILIAPLGAIALLVGLAVIGLGSVSDR